VLEVGHILRVQSIRPDGLVELVRTAWGSKRPLETYLVRELKMNNETVRAAAIAKLGHSNISVVGNATNGAILVVDC
jgi:hypothetical protein